MFRNTLILAVAALSCFCLPALASPLVDMSVIDRDSGRRLPQYPYRGDTWMAGTPGHRYQVRLTNTTGERVLVVLSVDGVNAVSGETADPSQSGYVLDPWETTEISGWRKSMSEVAQFVFTDLGDSYAARTGRPRNVGVIGIAVFQEYRAHYERNRNYSPLAAPAPAAPPSTVRRAGSAAEGAAMEDISGASADSDSRAMAKPAASPDRQQIGTGHGVREQSYAGRTQFVRATRDPAQVTELRYDTTQRLTALGVIPSRPRNVRPSAFPNGFVPDPPRYR